MITWGFLFLRLSRLPFLIGSSLFYILGAGLARYVGAGLDSGSFLLGLAWVLLIQLSTIYLNEYFQSLYRGRSPLYPGRLRNTQVHYFSFSSDVLGPEGLPPAIALWAGLTCLIIAASLSVPILAITQFDKQLAALTVLFMILITGASLLFALPPASLAMRGYGELTIALIYANFVPSLAFVLQTGDLQRLLSLVTFPLTLLLLSTLLVYNLAEYEFNLKNQHQTLMLRLGWEQGIALHHILVLLTYFMLGSSPLLGMPFSMIFPALLTLPLGLFQIWLVQRIGEGAIVKQQHWSLLTFSASALISLVTYLLAYTFWTR